jgi:hypothetical protein
MKGNVGYTPRKKFKFHRDGSAIIVIMIIVAMYIGTLCVNFLLGAAELLMHGVLVFIQKKGHVIGQPTPVDCDRYCQRFFNMTRGVWNGMRSEKTSMHPLH